MAQILARKLVVTESKHFGAKNFVLRADEPGRDGRHFDGVDAAEGRRQRDEEGFERDGMQEAFEMSLQFIFERD